MLLCYLVSSILVASLLVRGETSRGSRDSGDKYEKCTSSDCADNSACLTVFQHPNQRGWYQCLIFRGNECVTLNAWWIGSTGKSSRVSSVKTHGTCVRLYDGVGCSGRTIEVREGSPNHSDLSQLYFGDTMKSASSCERAPQPFREAVGFSNCSSVDCDGKNACVTVYENRDYGGWSSCVTIRDKECVNLNEWWYLRLYPRVSSVDTNGKCARLYEGEDCTRDFVELRPGSPHHQSLSTLSWEDRISSISACDRESVRMGYDVTSCTKSDCSGKAGCVTITASSGVKYCLKFKDDECITINDYGSTHERYGLRGNIWTHSANPHGACIRLYDGIACKGEFREVNHNTSQIVWEVVGSHVVPFKSVSSCRRKIVYNPECHVQTLFSRNIKSDEVSKASSNFLAVLDRTVTGISLAVPTVGAFYTFLKSVVGLFQAQKVEETLIDAKIEKAFARNSAAQVEAKIVVIDNRLKSLLSSATPPSEKLIDLKVALNSCEELKNLLENDNYSFSHNKVASSPYFVSFATLYISVAIISYEMRNYTEARNEIINDMRVMTILAEHYLTEGMKQRKVRFPDFNAIPNGFIEDKVVCDDVGSRYPADCAAYKKCTSRSNSCRMCLENISKSIEMEFEKFFRPVINELKRFPGQSYINATHESALAL